MVKRCQNRDKYVTKKQQDYKISRKKQLNSDWKKAEKFNEDILSYQKNKQFMSKTLKTENYGQLLSLEGEQGGEPPRQPRISDQSHIHNSISIMNRSKLYSPLNNSSNIFGITQY